MKKYLISLALFLSSVLAYAGNAPCFVNGQPNYAFVDEQLHHLSVAFNLDDDEVTKVSNVIRNYKFLENARPMNLWREPNKVTVLDIGPSFKTKFNEGYSTEGLKEAVQDSKHIFNSSSIQTGSDVKSADFNGRNGWYFGKVLRIETAVGCVYVRLEYNRSTPLIYLISESAWDSVVAKPHE